MTHLRHEITSFLWTLGKMEGNVKAFAPCIIACLLILFISFIIYLIMPLWFNLLVEDIGRVGVAVLGDLLPAVVDGRRVPAA